MLFVIHYLLVLLSINDAHPHKPRPVHCAQLIVFGDSLTDDGIELSENAHGFTRNSNGPVWSEYLNKLLGCDQYINYAYSGAKSGYDNVFFTEWSGILWQIEHFFISHPSWSTDALVVLQLGGILDLLGADLGADIEQTMSKIDENALQAVTALVENIDYGNVIVMNIVDPSDAPGRKQLDTGGHDISSLVAKANSHLWKAIHSEPSLSARMRLFDLNTVISDASRQLNTTAPFTYRQANLTSRQIYEYAYHDQWQPSTLVHRKIAEQLVKFLEDL